MRRQLQSDQIATPPVRWTLLFLALLGSHVWALRSNSGVTDPWGENQRPKLYTDYLTQHSDSAYRFLGNHTHTDYFKLLRKDGQSLLIGARNVIYNISLPSLQENVEQRITWDPTDEDRELCSLKGKSEVDCQNYIRVLAKTKDGRLLVCGTNAYNPKCRFYSHNETSYSVDREFSGRGFCPYDPRHNSTYLYADGELYSGTVADFSASDSLIIKDSLRTEQYDFKQLNSPDFVNALEDEEHVYFFFREAAVEHINCGKASFSRIARVCKSDTGGPHKFKNKWTSFLKSRLNCSVPGDTPFYFNEIQATTNFIQDGTDQVLYGVFNTPDNSIAGSAICAFRLSDITETFEIGPFKNQENTNSNWLPMSKSQIPEPRPGLCNVNGQNLPERNMNFIKRHSLMDWAVESGTKAPIFTKTSLGERLTVIAADPGVRSVEGSITDILFVGTTNGRVLKISSNSNTLIEAFQVFPYHVPVRNLLVSQDQIIVLSDHEVNAFPLHRCEKIQNCGDCVALQDPYCAWDLSERACLAHNQLKWSGLIQDLEHGYHEGCPLPEPVTTETSTTSTSTSTSTTSSSTTSSTTTSTFAPSTKSRVTVNSPNEDECTNCNCDCNSDTSVTSNPGLTMTSTESSSLLFPTIVPFYDDNSLEARQRENNKEQLTSFEAPYSSNGYETANSSPHYKESRRVKYSEQTFGLSIVLTALLALVIGFALGLLASKGCCQEQKLDGAMANEIYDKTLNFTNRAAHLMRGVGQRCSFYHQRPPAPPSTTSSESGSGSSPPSSVHMGQLDSGYTTPSNLTNASVNTQETSASSGASSPASTPTQGATPSASPNTIMLGSPQHHTMMLHNKSEAMKNNHGFPTLPRHYMQHQRQPQQPQQQPQSMAPNQPQMAVMGQTNTLQKVKRIYL